MSEPSSNVLTLEPPAPHLPVEAPAAQPAPASRASTLRAWVSHALPTLIILAALGGLAYWGHHTGWSMPRFSALAGNRHVAKDDWCAEHSVPESLCVECSQSLSCPIAYGWCKTHGVHECPWEYPQVAQLKTIPQITTADLEQAQRALAFAERPENNPKCQLHSRRVQFASQESMDKQGIEIDAVWRARMEETVIANGEVGYDQTRVASLATPAPGRVWRVEKQIGQPVKQGDLLALVDAAEVGKTKAEFLQAIAQANLRSQTLANMRSATAVLAGRQIQEAEAALSEAEARLLSAHQSLVNLGLPIRLEEVKSLAPQEIARRIQFLGLPEALVETLNPQLTTANLIPIKAPLDGVIVARKAVSGEMVDASKTLFVVADTRHMWLALHVRLEDTKYLSLGHPVRFQPDGSKERVNGAVTWISTGVDEKTRTVEVRADLANADGRLRAGTFGAGVVVLREEVQAIIVPNEAVHWDGSCHVVFVYDKDSPRKNAPKVFHVRSVRPGVKDEKNTEIIAGVLPGEIVATKNSGVVRGQLLKNNLGAGCDCCAPH